jgi:hypothetical protein
MRQVFLVERQYVVVSRFSQKFGLLSIIFGFINYQITNKAEIIRV